MKPQSTRFLFTLLLCLIYCSLHAQSSQREIGIRLTDWDHYSFIYKQQLSENNFRRIRVARARFHYSTDEFAEYLSLSLGAAVGKEKRKALNEKLQWLHGWEPGLSLSFDREIQKNINSDVESNILQISPYIGYVMGFQYQLGTHSYLGMEAIPSLNANIDIATEDHRDGLEINGNFSFGNVALFIVYRFDRRDQPNGN